MGEMAEYMINGDDCQECGVYMGEGDGYPRTCSDCQRTNRQVAAQVVRQMAPKVACPTCGKKVKAAGLKDHQRDAHAQSDRGAK